MVDLGEPSELKAHWHATVRACRARTQSLEEAEDCASQALLEALAKVGPPPRNPEAFLIRVALRRAVDANRRAMRDGQRAGKLARDLPPDVVDVAEGVVARALARWCVGEAAALPPATQAVFALWADGADAADIAEELQLSKRSVESHLYRTRRTLQSAWARSMAALTGLLWGLKRLTQGAPLAVTAAAMLLALPTLHGGNGSADSIPRTETAEFVRPTAVRPAHPVGTRLAPRDRPANVAIQRRVRTGSEALASQTLATVDSPAGTIVAVTRQDRGGDEQTPVDSVLACVQQFAISPERIGC